jgi:hypothetical protein
MADISVVKIPLKRLAKTRPSFLMSIDKPGVVVGENFQNLAALAVIPWRVLAISRYQTEQRSERYPGHDIPPSEKCVQDPSISVSLCQQNSTEVSADELYPG